MTRKARVAVIGTGWWSTYAHIPTLKEHPDVELVALADIRADILPQLSKHFRVEKTYTDFRQMLAKEPLDGVVVAVWHVSHYEVARACLERGLHILLEKPMVLEARHGRDLCELARKQNREIVMGYPWQFLQLSLRARGVLQSGSLGRVHFISNVFSSSPLHLYRGDDRSDQPEMASHYPLIGPGDVYSDPARSGGGQGHLQVTHSAALMFFLTGLKPSSVLALMDNLDVRVDVVNAIIARMDNGALASVGSTGAVHGGSGKLDIQVYSNNGWVDLDYIAGTGVIHHADGSTETLGPAPGEAGLSQSGYPDYPSRAPANHFVEVILGQSANRSPGEYGWRAVELLEAAYLSATRGGQAVSVASLYR